MESVIHLLMGFIVLNFILKIGFYPRWGEIGRAHV